MIKQQAQERLNNTDLDDLKVDKTKWERLFWPLLKPLIKKYLHAFIDQLFK